MLTELHCFFAWGWSRGSSRSTALHGISRFSIAALLQVARTRPLWFATGSLGPALTLDHLWSPRRDLRCSLFLSKQTWTAEIFFWGGGRLLIGNPSAQATIWWYNLIPLFPMPSLCISLFSLPLVLRISPVPVSFSLQAEGFAGQDGTAETAGMTAAWRTTVQGPCHSASWIQPHQKKSLFFSAKGSNHTNDDEVYLVSVLGRKHQWNKPADKAGAVLGRRVFQYRSQNTSWRMNPLEMLPVNPVTSQQLLLPVSWDLSRL